MNRFIFGFCITVSILVVIYLIIALLVYKNVIKQSLILWKPFYQFNSTISIINSSNNNSQKNANTAGPNNPPVNSSTSNSSNSSNSTSNTTQTNTSNSNNSQNNASNSKANSSSSQITSNSNSSSTSNLPILAPSNTQCTGSQSLLNQSAFSSDTNNLPSYDSLSIPDNQAKVTAFCELGKTIADCQNQSQSGSSFLVRPQNDSKFNKYCCDNTQYGIVSQKCVFEKSKLHSQSYNLSNLNTHSLTQSDVQNTLVDFCQTGSDILANNCEIDEFHPVNDANYKKFCCNSVNVDAGNCNHKSLQCMLDKSDFANQIYNFQNFNDSSLINTQNQADLTKVCDIGISIINNQCAVDENYPLNNPQFRKYCCNNGSACSTNTVQCSFDSAQFLEQSNQLQTFNTNAITSNLTMLNSFCELGQSLLTNNCKSIVDPLNDSVFQKICCNQTSNVSTCMQNSLENLSVLGKYIDASTSITSSFNDMSISSNTNQLDQFCSSGNTLLASKLVGIENPLNNSSFSKYCCNGTHDGQICQNSSSATCLHAAGQFLPKDYTMKNFNINSVSNNLQYLLDYCSSGQSLVDNKCVAITNASNSDSFNKYCANTGCLGNIGSFQNYDNSLSNLNPSSYAANSGQIQTYCNAGFSLISDSCTSLIDPRNSNTFHTLCCNGSNDSSNCNQNALQCLIDQSNFNNKSYDLSNLANYQPSWQYNDGTIHDYCLTAKRLSSNCQIQPNNNTYNSLSNYCYSKWPETSL